MQAREPKSFKNVSNETRIRGTPLPMQFLLPIYSPLS